MPKRRHRDSSPARHRSVPAQSDAGTNRSKWSACPGCRRNKSKLDSAHTFDSACQWARGPPVTADVLRRGAALPGAGIETTRGATSLSPHTEARRSRSAPRATDSDAQEPRESAARVDLPPAQPASPANRPLAGMARTTSRARSSDHSRRCVGPALQDLATAHRSRSPERRRTAPGGQAREQDHDAPEPPLSPSLPHIGSQAPPDHDLHPTHSQTVPLTDVLATYWRKHVEPTSGLSPLKPVAGRSHTSSTLLHATPAALEAALLEWIAVGTVEVVHKAGEGGPFPGGAIRWHDVPLPSPPPPPPLQAAPRPSPRQPLAFLDLFSGLTFGRCGLDECLDRLNVSPQHFATSGFVEINDNLVDGAQRAWAASARAGNGPQHRFVASNVWGLFLPADSGGTGPLLIDAFLDDVPVGALLILSSGSPCNQASRITTHKGALGLLGADSRHFWAVPLLAWVIQQRRPDLNVHVIQEMVDTILQVHLRAMLAALGVPAENYLQHIDSGEWSHLPRKRYWIASFKVAAGPSDSVSFTKLPIPWAAGWGFHWQGVPPTATRSREVFEGHVLSSTYQCHPGCTLIDYQHDSCWDLLTMTQIYNRVRGLLITHDAESSFPGAASGLEAVLAFKERIDGNEPQARQFMRWLAVHGAPLGIRMPSALERARATGHLEHVLAHNLAPRELFDAVGCHFDPRSFHRRCRPLLRAWAHGEPLPAHRFPCPTTLIAIHADLRREVRRLHPRLVIPDGFQNGPAPTQIASHLQGLGLWPGSDGTAAPTAAGPPSEPAGPSLASRPEQSPFSL